MYSSSDPYPSGGKPNPPRPKLRPKQKYLNSDGTYSGYSGTAEGIETIEAKRARLYKNSGPSNTNWGHKNRSR